MKWLCVASVALTLNLCAATVGSGTAESEDRPVSDFSKIELQGTGTLTITQGSKSALKVTTDDNLLGQLETTVANSTLTLGPTQGLKPKTPIEYHVTMKTLKEIDVEGAAEVQGDGVIDVDNLSMDLDGAAKVDLALKGKKLDVEINGASQVTLSGEVKSQEVEIDGAGKYHALDLKTERTEIEINGAGKAQVYATEKLDVEVNGIGSVTYKGDPKVTQQIRGYGSVTRYSGP